MSPCLSDTFDAQVVGSFGGAIEITGVRNSVSASDTFWNLCVYATTGCSWSAAVSPTATAWAAAQKVEVYPVQMHQPVPAQTGGNTVGQFTITMPVTTQPNSRPRMAA